MPPGEAGGGWGWGRPFLSRAQKIPPEGGIFGTPGGSENFDFDMDRPDDRVN